jgi:hypothetical protein
LITLFKDGSGGNAGPLIHYFQFSVTSRSQRIMRRMATRG